MTLKELGKCFKKLWYVVAGVPLLSFLATFAVAGFIIPAISGTQYVASTVITANTQIEVINGIARNQLNLTLGEYGDLQGSVALSNATSSISIQVDGKNENDCVQALSQTVERTISVAKDLFSEDSIDANGKFLASLVVDAQEINVSEKGSLLSTKVLGIAVLSGLFIAVCIVLVIYSIKKPILSKGQIEEDTGSIVIAEISKNPDSVIAKSLLANVRFAGRDNDIRSIVVLPVGSKAGSRRVSELILQAFDDEKNSGGVIVSAEEYLSGSESRPGFVVVECEPLSLEIAGAYASQKADASIIAVEEWNDSLMALRDVLEELGLAGGTIAGIVLFR